MARILISGASGFIGAPLLLKLKEQGHAVVSLSRSPNLQGSSIQWDPMRKIARKSDFEGFDAVIHLAGEPIPALRWTQKKKEAIFQSRVKGTAFLTDLLLEVKKGPSLFFCASAIGYYGNRGEEVLKENASMGSGFLSGVCQAWEEQAKTVEKRGIRVAIGRFGMVLGAGGLLKRLKPAYQMGLGATLGSGRQWLSWIHVEDLASAIAFILEEKSLSGPINLVSPNPVRQKEFSQMLAKALKKPHFLTIPAPLLKWIFQEVAEELLLSSCKAMPLKMLDSKFHFNYPDLRSALFELDFSGF